MSDSTLTESPRRLRSPFNGEVISVRVPEDMDEALFAALVERGFEEIRPKKAKAERVAG